MEQNVGIHTVESCWFFFLIPNINPTNKRIFTNHVFDVLFSVINVYGSVHTCLTNQNDGFIEEVSCYNCSFTLTKDVMQPWHFRQHCVPLLQSVLEVWTVREVRGPIHPITA